VDAVRHEQPAFKSFDDWLNAAALGSVRADLSFQLISTELL
jgi:hypothetical protein